MPLAYFLTYGPLKAVQQEEFLKEAIVLLHNVGVRVRCIVCDGTRTNTYILYEQIYYISTLESLGSRTQTHRSSPQFCASLVTRRGDSWGIAIPKINDSPTRSLRDNF